MQCATFPRMSLFIVEMHPLQLSCHLLQQKLSARLSDLEPYIALLFDKKECIGCSLSKDQCYRFLKNLKATVPVDIMRYDAGGGSTCVVFQLDGQYARER